MSYFWIIFMIIWMLLISIYKTLAKCPDGMTNSFNTNIDKMYDPNSFENPKLREAFTPRPGIHYVVVPNSLYLVNNPQSKCPQGSSPTYIKNKQEWDDWKFILGSEFIVHF